MPATAQKVNGIDASYYLTKDLKASTKFYTELLGLEPTFAAPDLVSEWTFSGGETFGLYKPEKAEDFHPSGGVMFAVDDISAAVAECKGRGITFFGDVEETPVCHMAFGVDPEGNGFIFHKRK